MNKKHKLDRLMLGIKSIISESRSSLSDEEVSLLEDCLTYLETEKSKNDSNGSLKMKVVAKVIEILLRIVLNDSEKLKEIFF